MLIRNATAYISGSFQEGTELRLMHGAVQEIGCGLVKGLYESEMDLQGDWLLPGFILRAEPGCLTEQARAAYRLGTAILAAEVDLPPRRRCASVQRREAEHLLTLTELRACIAEKRLPPASIMLPMFPGTPAPLSRWSRDGQFISVIDEHSAD